MQLRRSRCELQSVDFVCVPFSCVYACRIEIVKTVRSSSYRPLKCNEMSSEESSDEISINNNLRAIIKKNTLPKLNEYPEYMLATPSKCCQVCLRRWYDGFSDFV